MNVVLVNVSEPLAGHLAAVLRAYHNVRIMSGDVRDIGRCLSFADCDVLVHGLGTVRDPVEQVDCATRGTWNLLTTTSARRYVQVSSMRLFTTYARGWEVDERWCPRPTTDPVDIACYLAEIASRELARSARVECLVLRLDAVIQDNAWPSDGQSLHIADAVEAVRCAVECELSDDVPRWQPFNIVAGGESRFPPSRLAESILSFTPRYRHERAVPAHPRPEAPRQNAALERVAKPKRITILGAGGPLAAATTLQLSADRRLRLCDIELLAERAARRPQSPGAPLPTPAEQPHEEVIVDITDATAVHAAARGAECLINCTVVRQDVAAAFRVNVLGAYNVMLAAAAWGIPRVVHTGPIQTLARYPAGYEADRAVTSEAPPRPGDDVYLLSKYLGQEICRIFAEEHRIACPVLLFREFVDAKAGQVASRTGPWKDSPMDPFTVSWSDAARAVVAATDIDHLPHPCPVIHILADSPHDRFDNTAAKEILGWSPLDRLDHLWWRV